MTKSRNSQADLPKYFFGLEGTNSFQSKAGDTKQQKSKLGKPVQMNCPWRS